MNDMVSSRKTGGLVSSGTLQSLAGARARRIQASADEHAIAVAEKAVSLFNRVPISGENMFASGESANQHQQAGFRQVEVSKQRSNQAEVESRRNKYLCLA
jgi:hypothetical protein